MKNLLVLLLVCLPLQVRPADWPDEGVSLELAQHRKQTIQDLRYQLSFRIPADKTADIQGQETVTFKLGGAEDIILDFRESADKIHQVSTLDSKGRPQDCDYRFQHEHLIIPKASTHKGKNQIHISFTAGNQSLNRRDGYLYTLFVPDRARTVFPCFEQPNLKAVFQLSLTVPEGWTAVSNSSPDTLSAGTEPHAAGLKTIHFRRTEPLPTYLFAFAAGEFQHQYFPQYGVGTYYRETDTLRLRQLPEIARQVRFALDWQEEFTHQRYPFQKYDFVVLPGFQFGGMEHTGCTFYNDNTLFLPANPTPDEELRRTELISHETSHMWFGDAVTMDWFNDVWTKEVFANYFAAEITAPLFPHLNHNLNWLKTYVAAAVSQDRTQGRTSIRQPLGNMRNAGLIYNSIIYNKAPVMMRKMVSLMGKDAFRRGIRKYVKKYMYGNATWDDLINILDAQTPADLKAFSRDWVDTARWPQYQAASYDDPRIGTDYGWFTYTPLQVDSTLSGWRDIADATHRQAVLMNLNENYLNHRITDARWLRFLTDRLATEQDALTASTLISYMSEPLRSELSNGAQPDTELYRLAGSHPLGMARTQLLRLLASHATTPQVVDSLYGIWRRADSPLLSINDYMTLSYELSVRLPQKAAHILSTQRSRITNPDRLAQFDFISRSVNPSQAARDSLFRSLALPQNRRIEPWTLSVLYYLNHPLRQQQAIKYIQPALQMLPDIQRTGDIFFPGNWCGSLLSGHRSVEACRQVETFLEQHTDMLPLLRNKILSAEYYLKRVTEK